MKKTLKAVSSLSVLLMVMFLLTGCGSNTAEETEVLEEENAPIVEEVDVTTPAEEVTTDVVTDSAVVETTTTTTETPVEVEVQ